MNKQIAEMYRLILKCGWTVEKYTRHQKDYWMDPTIVVLEIELVGPNKMVDHYVLLGPPGTSHG